MFVNLDLQFEKGTILTKEMLKELRDTAKDMLDIKYQQYPDGILSGMEVYERSGCVRISGGLLKYNNRIYRNAAETNLTERILRWREQGRLESQKRYRLYLEPLEDTDLDGRVTQRMHAIHLNVVPDDIQAQGIPFASFRLTGQGTIAIFHRADLQDISRAAFWNMTACPYACRKGITYHPYIFETIQDILSKKERKSALDYVILNDLAEKGVLGFEMIRLVMKENGMETPSGMIIKEADRAKVLHDLLEAVRKEADQDQVSDLQKKEEEYADLEEDGRMLP